MKKYRIHRECQTATDIHRASRFGAAAVEFAVAATVLVLLVFAGIEFTRVFMLRHTVDHAAYVATRQAIVPGANSSTVLARAREHLDTIGVVNADVQLDPSEITESTRVVEVRIMMPVASNSLVVPRFVSGDLVGVCRMMTERAPMIMSKSLPTPPPSPPPGPPSPPPPRPIL